MNKMENTNINSVESVEIEFSFVKELLKSSSLDTLNEEIKYDESIENNE